MAGAAGTAALLAVAYYAGSNIGFVLRLPPLTPSVLWPPNAILTAALLLAPVHRWWLYLAAALPAHVLAQWGWPPALVLAFFLTNSSEALIASWLVRRWSDEPTRLDTLGRVLVFVGAAGVLAPFASSFLDAGVVTALLGQPYWLVWRARFFSNVLSALTVTPAIVLAATAAWPRLRGTSPRRRVEAALLAVALAAVAVAVLAGTARDPRPIAGLPLTPVTLFLPVVLWAAVRFGPGGVSASTLATTLLLTWAVTQGRGPFAALSPSESVLALQLHLSVSIVPLMCLAGLIEERRRVVAALAERLSFEALVARLSGSFVHLPSDRMDAAFGAWLARIGAFLALDRVSLLRVAEGGRVVRAAHAWQAPGVAAAPPADFAADFPWTVARLLRQEPTVLAAVDDVPAEGARDRAALTRDAVRSQVVLPLVAGHRVCGGLTFAATRAGRAWPADLVARMQLIAQVFGSALARKESEDAMRASELEAQRSRQELAHVTRVSAMGELTASLAHELNQPLTGILTNAQAGQRFLDATPVPLDELRDILADIVADDKRAAEVIWRVRDLVRKGDPEMAPLDIDALVREVTKLVSGDAGIRGVTLVLDLRAAPALVSGDRVQLQQVLLNLLLNAMEAMAESQGGERLLTVRSRHEAATAVSVAVEDAGPGLPAETPELVFEPFYTTKRTGMGMGLAIAQSIVVAHGGAIAAANNAGGRGATVWFSLPVLGVAAP